SGPRFAELCFAEGGESFRPGSGNIEEQDTAVLDGHCQMSTAGRELHPPCLPVCQVCRGLHVEQFLSTHDIPNPKLAIRVNRNQAPIGSEDEPTCDGQAPHLSAGRSLPNLDSAILPVL